MKRGKLGVGPLIAAPAGLFLAHNANYHSIVILEGRISSIQGYELLSIEYDGFWIGYYI